MLFVKLVIDTNRFMAGLLKESIDENDAPFLAVGLSINLDGIWTEDLHFFSQDLIRVFRTSDLISVHLRK